MKQERVAILPYRRYNDKIQFLVKDEVVKHWNGFPTRCAITTKLKNDNPEKSIIKGMLEQSGYKFKKNELYDLQQCFGDKEISVCYHLYSVDLTGVKRVDELPKYDECAWVDNINSSDPLLYLLYFRLVRLLKSMLKSGKRISKE